MKKHALITFIVICACSMTVLAETGIHEEFSRSILKAEEINHPIFEKVFPGIQFSVETGGPWVDPSMRVVGWFQGERFVMTDEFNFLYDKVADSSRASVDERIEAFIRFCYWLLDPDLTVISQEKVSIDIGIGSTKEPKTPLSRPRPPGPFMNHRTVVQLHHENNDPEELEVLVDFKNNRIKWVIVCKDGKPIYCPPLLFGHGMDDVDLAISGNVKVEPPDYFC